MRLGKVVRRYSSVNEAVRELGIPARKKAYITNCCSGRSQTAFSFKWAYCADTSQPPDAKSLEELICTIKRRMEGSNGKRMNDMSNLEELLPRDTDMEWLVTEVSELVSEVVKECVSE